LNVDRKVAPEEANAPEVASRDPAEDEKAFAAEKHVATVRALVIGFNVFVYLVWLRHADNIPELAYTICVVASAYALIVLIYRPYRRFAVVRSAWFTAVTDASLIVLWIAATGGYHSPFYVLWYVSLAAVGFRFSATVTGVVSTVYAALYVALLAFIGELFIDPVEVGVRVAYIFLIALLVGYQARETYTQTRDKIRMREAMLETKRAEDRLLQSDTELRRSLSLLTATLDSTTDGILVVDPQNKITLFNQRFIEMWKIPADVIASRDDSKAIGYVLDQLVSADDFVAKVKGLYADPLASSFDVLEFKDGRVFERYSLPQVLEGQPIGRVWSFRDVTERRKAELENLRNVERAKEVDRLRELDRFKTQFVNSVAHELWTPLTPIQLQLHLLQKNFQTGLTQEQKHAVDIISRNMERLRRLVGELLDGARLQAGRFRVQRVPMNLHSVLLETIELFRAPAEDAGVRLAASLQPELPVEADASRMVQVLYNLLSNALKFTPRGGRIDVVSKIDDGHVRVLVRDTGAGLTEDQRALLFQAFSQVHDTMQQTRAGTGLGLYISRAILEAHQGTLTAASDGPGLGSTFEFTLPLSRAAQIPSSSAATKSPAHPGQRA
jgi:signal transduction histidine kinase